MAPNESQQEMGQANDGSSSLKANSPRELVGERSDRWPKMEPKLQSVRLPTGTVKKEVDSKSWLGTPEGRIREKLKVGPVVV